MPASDEVRRLILHATAKFLLQKILFCVAWLGEPSEPKKNPPYDFCWYYSNAWEFLYEILHDC